MWSIAVLVCTALIIAYEVPPMLKKRKIKELWTFSVLLAVALIAGIAQSLRIDIANPLDLITMIYKPIGKGIESMFS